MRLLKVATRAAVVRRLKCIVLVLDVTESVDDCWGKGVLMMLTVCDERDLCVVYLLAFVLVMLISACSHLQAKLAVLIPIRCHNGRSSAR